MSNRPKINTAGPPVCKLGNNDQMKAVVDVELDDEDDDSIKCIDSFLNKVPSRN